MKPTYRDIIRVVAANHGMPVSELLSSNRCWRISRARQQACYLLRAMTPHSYPKIAQVLKFGCHTTCLHAVWAIQRRNRECPRHAALVRKMAHQACREGLRRRLIVSETIGAFAKGLASGANSGAVGEDNYFYPRNIPKRKFVSPFAVYLPRRAKVVKAVVLPSNLVPPSKARLMGAR